MLGYTHIAIATSTTAMALAAAGGHKETIPIIAAAGIASLIPDIDEPQSKIGRKLPGISHLAKWTLGHRGLTHTIYAVAFCAALSFAVGLSIWGKKALPYSIAISWGYFSHIYLGDIFTRSGVPILNTKKSVGIPKSQFRRIKTGSSRENWVFLGCTITLAISVLFITEVISIPPVNMPEIHLHLPSWFYIPPIVIPIVTAILIICVLLAWSRIHWRYVFSNKGITYKVYFSHQSKDLPLRSEQLGNLLHNIILPRYMRIFTGQPHITITYAGVDGKSLYVTVPDIRGYTDKVKDALLDKLRGCKLEETDFSISEATTNRRYGRLKLYRKSPAYSLRTLKGFEEDDPLETVFNSLEVGEGGKSYIFILLKPIGPRWKKSARKIREKIRTSDDGDMDKAMRGRGLFGVISYLFNAGLGILSELISGLQWNPSTSDAFLLTSAMSPTREKDKRRELSEETKDIVKSIDDKINCRASFRAEIRIMVEKDDACFNDVDRIASTFRQYDKHNSLCHNRSYGPGARLMDYLTRNNLWPLLGSKTIFSSDELAGLLHSPYKNTTLVKMDMHTSRSAPAQPALSQYGKDRVYFGTNVHRDGAEPISIPWSDYYLHSMICGMSGSGKTTLLKHILLQWIDSGDPDHPRGCCFIEPHGDASSELIQSIPARSLDRVYYLNPADTEYPLAFNPLAYSDIMSRDHIRDTIIAAFKAIWEITPEMANLMLYLPRTIDVLAQVPGSHFGWIRPFIENQDFRTRVLSEVTDNDTLDFWHNFSQKTKKLREEEVRSLLNRVDSFLLDTRLRLIFAQAKTRLDFKRFMDEGKILICHFGDHNTGVVNKRLLGNLISSYIHQACQSRDPERRPFLLCLDECSEYLSPTLASVLSQDRKFGIAITLSFQYLAQVEELINAIKGNTTTRMSFQIGEEDAQVLAPLFTSSSDPEEVRDRSSDLMNLERFQGFLKTSVGGKPVPPTTFKISKPLEAVHWENMEHVRNNTRRDLCYEPTETEGTKYSGGNFF